MANDTHSSPERIEKMCAATLRLLASGYRTENDGPPQIAAAWYPGIDSRWDTPASLVTEALIGPESAQGIPGMARYLLSLQRADGGWEDAAGDGASGRTVSVLAHAAIVAVLREECASEPALRRALEEALEKSWRYLNGRPRSGRRSLRGLPFLRLAWWGVRRRLNPLALLYYGAVFRPLPLRAGFSFLLLVAPPVVYALVRLSLPQVRGKGFARGLKAHIVQLGWVPQSKDILFASLALFAPAWRLRSRLLAGVRDELLHTRAENGLFCYLPFATGLAVLALRRLEKHHAFADDKGVVEGSLKAMRDLRQEARDGIRVLPYAPVAWPTAIFVDAKVREAAFAAMRARETTPRLLAEARLFQGIEYLLACQLPSTGMRGLFQQQWRGNERDEGELMTTGYLVSFLVRIREILASPWSGSEDSLVAELRKRIDEAIREGVDALLRMQNASGGFATFRRTDREKRRPGPQHDLHVDASAADLTAFCLQGLAAAYPRDSRGKAITEAIERAGRWLERDFDSDAGWWSRYGGGYVAGNSRVVRALALLPAGSETRRLLWPQVEKVVGYLRGWQKEDGGFGLIDGTGGSGSKAGAPARRSSHPSLTAQALCTLLEAGVAREDPAIEKGFEYLASVWQDPTALLERLASEDPTAFLHGERSEAGWRSPYPIGTFMENWAFDDEFLVDGDCLGAFQELLALAEPLDAGIRRLLFPQLDSLPPRQAASGSSPG